MTRRRLPVSSPARQALSRLFALLVASAFLLGGSVASAHYYCSAMEEVNAEPCCGHGAGARDDATLEQSDCGCCVRVASEGLAPILPSAVAKIAAPDNETLEPSSAAPAHAELPRAQR
jgi:hypothetical protein